MVIAISIKNIRLTDCKQPHGVDRSRLQTQYVLPISKGLTRLSVVGESYPHPNLERVAPDNLQGNGLDEDGSFPDVICLGHYR